MSLRDSRLLKDVVLPLPAMSFTARSGAHHRAMRQALNVVVLVMALLGLVACGGRTTGSGITRSDLLDIRPGMPMTDVEALLGPPGRVIGAPPVVGLAAADVTGLRYHCHFVPVDGALPEQGWQVATLVLDRVTYTSSDASLTGVVWSSDVPASANRAALVELARAVGIDPSSLASSLWQTHDTPAPGGPDADETSAGQRGQSFQRIANLAFIASRGNGEVTFGDVDLFFGDDSTLTLVTRPWVWQWSAADGIDTMDLDGEPPEPITYRILADVPLIDGRLDPASGRVRALAVGFGNQQEPVAFATPGL